MHSSQHDDELAEPFRHSRQDELNKLMEGNGFYIVPRKNTTCYLIIWAPFIDEIKM